MLSQIKKSFSIVNNNLILSQPFVLYLLVLTLAMGAMASRTNLFASVVLVVSLSLLTIAFIAGWFYMAQKTIEFEKTTLLEGEEKAMKSFALFKEFFPGVGEYFLPVLLTVILYFVILFLIFWGAYELGAAILGAPNIDLLKLNEASKSYVTMKAYVNTLSASQVMLLFKWILYMSSLSVAYQFATMWWFAALFYESKNPFKALLRSFAFLGRKLAPSFGVYTFLIFFNFVVSFVNSLMGNNIFLALISFVLFFYYATYYIVLIFLYYGEEKENYCNSRPDGDGQEQPWGETGEGA